MVNFNPIFNIRFCTKTFHKCQFRKKEKGWIKIYAQVNQAYNVIYFLVINQYQCLQRMSLNDALPVPFDQNCLLFNHKKTIEVVNPTPINMRNCQVFVIQAC